MDNEETFNSLAKQMFGKAKVLEDAKGKLDMQMGRALQIMRHQVYTDTDRPDGPEESLALDALKALEKLRGKMLGPMQKAGKHHRKAFVAAAIASLHALAEFADTMDNSCTCRKCRTERGEL